MGFLLYSHVSNILVIVLVRIVPEPYYPANTNKYATVMTYGGQYNMTILIQVSLHLGYVIRSVADSMLSSVRFAFHDLSTVFTLQAAYFSLALSSLL